MQDSVYNSVFGALTQKYRLDIIANNLANASTIGYKKDKLSFEDVLIHYAHDFNDPNLGITGGVRWPEKDLNTQPRIGEKQIDFSQGDLRRTQNPLDLAIGGQGFFKLQTPYGIMYTRAGNFTLDKDGFIVSNNGYKLLGKGGPIQIAGRGKITITEDGVVYVGNTQVGIIDIVDFQNKGLVKKFGQNLYKSNPNNEKPVNNPKIYQGYLEGSNVQVVEEMVKMIDTLRNFEAMQRVMTNTNDEDRNVINKVGNPT